MQPVFRKIFGLKCLEDRGNVPYCSCFKSICQILFLFGEMKLLAILACGFCFCSPAEQNYDYFVDKNPDEYDQAVDVDGADPAQGQDSQKKQNGKDGGEELPPCSEVH